LSWFTYLSLTNELGESFAEVEGLLEATTSFPLLANLTICRL
jgi:hypothetical protein